MLSLDTSFREEPTTLTSPVAELPFLVRFSLADTALGISTLDSPCGSISTISVAEMSERPCSFA